MPISYLLLAVDYRHFDAGGFRRIDFSIGAHVSKQPQGRRCRPISRRRSYALLRAIHDFISMRAEHAIFLRGLTLFEAGAISRVPY